MKVVWPNNPYGAAFCSSPHPDHRFTDEDGNTLPSVFCRRQPGHDGAHAAFIHKISEPEHW